MKDLEEILSLKDNSIVKHNSKVERIEGIYFLFDNNEIIYIGKSFNIHKRIYAHKMSGLLFDSFAFLKIDVEQLMEIEREYISKYQPKNNVYFTKNKNPKILNKKKLISVTVQLEDDSHEFLKTFSFEKTGKENLSSAIRILIKEKRTSIKNQK